MSFDGAQIWSKTFEQKQITFDKPQLSLDLFLSDVSGDKDQIQYF